MTGWLFVGNKAKLSQIFSFEIESKRTNFVKFIEILFINPDDPHAVQVLVASKTDKETTSVQFHSFHS